MGRQITRGDVLGYSKKQLVSKLSGKFDRISGKIREFNNLSDTAGEDYTRYVKNFISDKYFNSVGTLNKGRKHLNSLSENELRKLFLKTIAIGESPTMKSVNTYTKAIVENEKDLSHTIQTQMEQLGIDEEIIQTFLQDTKQVYKFTEMLKIHKNVYNSEVLKTFTEYADTENKELIKNMNRMIKAYEQNILEKKFSNLTNEREKILNDIARGDMSGISRLQNIQNQIDDIRGKDMR